ncbi:MAG: hypothetical protein IJV16_04360, partial [Lachnospiraceae bacterium]|nr:hypothetical protein [Lachnospiraceae bacterium]
IMIPANIIMGLIMIATGAVFTFGDTLGLSGFGETFTVAAALVFCVIYGVIIMHFQNKYLK